MRLKLASLVRKYIGVGDYIIDAISPEFLLHLHYVVAESVFSGDFITLREVIDPLVLIKTLVQILLAG